MTIKRFFASLSMMCIALAVFPAESMAAGNRRVHDVEARLHGSGTVRAEAHYDETRMSDGGKRERFRVEVSRARPGKQYVVRVNGRAVGAMRVRGNGRASLELRTQRYINGNGCEPIPSDFPCLDTGDCVTVGSMCGIVYDCDDRGWQKFRIEGESESEGVEVEARYEEKYKRGDVGRRFKVEVEDAEPHTTYDVLVNDEAVASITTDDDGEGKLCLRSGWDSSGNHETLSESFPSLVAGDRVTVAGVTVILGQDDDDDDGDDHDDDDDDGDGDDHDDDD